MTYYLLCRPKAAPDPAVWVLVYHNAVLTEFDHLEEAILQLKRFEANYPEMSYLIAKIEEKDFGFGFDPHLN